MLLSDRSPTSQEGVGLRGGWREGRVWKWKERKGRSCSKGLGRKGRRDRIYIFVTRDNLMEPQASGLMGPVGPGPMRRWAQTCCWTPAEEPSLISWAALIIMSEFTRQGIGNWEWASPRCLMRTQATDQRGILSHNYITYYFRPYYVTTIVRKQ